jgi:threonine dehydrogenase-like Zn-dependent dehydrogenase
MRALVYTGPNTLVYRDERDPTPANDEVLVQVSACGICGSDMHAYHGHDERRPAPLILGHEAAGVVASGPRKGQRVTVNPLVSCGTCDMCHSGRAHLCAERMIVSMPKRPGALAEYITVPEDNLVALPDHLDATQAALAEPIAVSYHAVDLGIARLARPVSAATCTVLGGGAIGLTSALCLALRGARDIRLGEPHAGRRKTAEKAGPIKAYDPAGPHVPADGTVDLVIDAVGAAATRAAAFKMVRPGGVIVHLGLIRGSEGVDVRRMTLQEITFMGSFCYTKVDFRETVAALAGGHFGPLNWFETRAMKDGARAFQDIDAGKTDFAKIILHP